MPKEPACSIGGKRLNTEHGHDSFTKKTIGGVVQIEPALTPRSCTTRPRVSTQAQVDSARPRPRNATSPKACGQMPFLRHDDFRQELDENSRSVPSASTISPSAPANASIRSSKPAPSRKWTRNDHVDVLNSSYKTKLERTARHHAQGRRRHRHLQNGHASRGLGVMDFGFMGGSMGSVVGEKLTRLIERAPRRLALIIISTSGGARMQEGVFSSCRWQNLRRLAYHAKHACLHQRADEQQLRRVMASYAALGDLILPNPPR